MREIRSTDPQNQSIKAKQHVAQVHPSQETERQLNIFFSALNMPSTRLRSKALVTPKSKRTTAPPKRAKPNEPGNTGKFITAGQFSAGLKGLKQLFLRTMRGTPENADSSDGESSGSESSGDVGGG